MQELDRKLLTELCSDVKVVRAEVVSIKGMCENLRESTIDQYKLINKNKDDITTHKAILDIHKWVLRTIGAAFIVGVVGLFFFLIKRTMPTEKASIPTTQTASQRP